MRFTTTACALALTLAALPVSAQQTAPNAAPNAARQIPTSRVDAAPGQTYRIAEHGDWALQCVRLENVAFDPCEIHQILLNTDGAATAEISLFPVKDDQVAAALSVMTPLETFLPTGLQLQVPGRDTATFPFQFCNRQGCVVQTGLKAEVVDALRAGDAAKVVIRPAAARTETVELTVSLSGFTAAMKALTDLPQ